MASKVEHQITISRKQSETIVSGAQSSQNIAVLQGSVMALSRLQVIDEEYHVFLFREFATIFLVISFAMGLYVFGVGMQLRPK